MKKLIFSLAIASAVLMTIVTTSCKKDNAKQVNNSTTVDPAKLAAAQKEYDDARAELKAANKINEGDSPYATALAKLETKNLSKDKTKDAKIAAIAAAQAKFDAAEKTLKTFPKDKIKL